MPRDQLGDYGEGEEEDVKSGKALGTRRKFDEFECPTCSAHNPFETFGNNDDVLCNWCGLSFRAVVTAEGELKLKEL